MESVVAQLGRIRTGNTYTLRGQTKNYLTDVGLHVFVWRATPFLRNELPGLIARDLDEPVVQATPMSEGVLRQLHLQVEVVLGGDTPIVDLWKAYADIDSAIGEGRESVWADFTGATRPRINRSVVDQDSAKIAGGIIEFYIDYPTLAFQSVA